jgi:hypothetical protein
MYAKSCKKRRCKAELLRDVGGDKKPPPLPHLAHTTTVFNIIAIAADRATLATS